MKKYKPPPKEVQQRMKSDHLSFMSAYEVAQTATRFKKATKRQLEVIERRQNEKCEKIKEEIVKRAPALQKQVSNF